VTYNLDTFATALYAKIDDLLRQSPHRAAYRPAAGTSLQIGDAGLVTMAVMQALLGSRRKPARCGMPVRVGGHVLLP